ncbi:MAG: helix-turn-helix transcriptional regulator [Lachnospiraceae bacterium]|nr:helix-turn-helix transcriptional regulator [Lachnospiraceae bacterium]
MICAYDKTYLDVAMTSMGGMCHFAVYDVGYGFNDFFELFIKSRISKALSVGEPKYIAGMSGIELVYEVIWDVTNTICETEPKFCFEKSPEYWTGWITAYFQWRSGISYNAIYDSIKPDEIMDMNGVYHEMDITSAYEEILRIVRERSMITRLKAYRQRFNMSQSELAEKSGVSLRMIQNYEQRRKNINKAQGDTLLSLARALHCNMEELIEAI